MLYSTRQYFLNPSQKNLHRPVGRAYQFVDASRGVFETLGSLRLTFGDAGLDDQRKQALGGIEN